MIADAGGHLHAELIGGAHTGRSEQQNGKRAM